MKVPLRPTGNMTPDGKVEVVNPVTGGASGTPTTLTRDQLRASMDPSFMARYPHLSPHRAWPTDELGYRMGSGLGKFWRKTQSRPWSSNLMGAGAGALGATGLSYLLDALGYRLFDKEPMSGKTRALFALSGLVGGGLLNNYMRKGASASGWSADAHQLMVIRQRLAAQVMGSALPVDLKSQVLRLLDQIGGQQLVELARVVSPLAGSIAGIAIAKFFFGNTYLPSVAGGILGAAAGHSALAPRRNAMGKMML